MFLERRRKNFILTEGLRENEKTNRKKPSPSIIQISF
jgi:hypothetical protein